MIAPVGFEEALMSVVSRRDEKGLDATAGVRLVICTELCSRTRRLIRWSAQAGEDCIALTSEGACCPNW